MPLCVACVLRAFEALPDVYTAFTVSTHISSRDGSILIDAPSLRLAVLVAVNVGVTLNAKRFEIPVVQSDLRVRDVLRCDMYLVVNDGSRLDDPLLQASFAEIAGLV